MVYNTQNHRGFGLRLQFRYQAIVRLRKKKIKNLVIGLKADWQTGRVTVDYHIDDDDDDDDMVCDEIRCLGHAVPGKKYRNLALKVGGVSNLRQ
jgi:hypothetical protein